MPCDEIESLVEGVGSLEMSTSSLSNVENKSCPGPGNCRPPHHPHTRQFPPKRNSSNVQEFHMGHDMKATYYQSASVMSKRTYKMTSLVMHQDGEDSRVRGKELSESTQYGDLEVKEDARDQPIPSGSKDSHGLLESANFGLVSVKSGAKYCPSPQGSFYSAAQYLEARQSFSNTEVTGYASSPEATDSCDLVGSQKTSIYRESTGSEVSEESSSTSFSSATYKPHKANDTRWMAIRAVRARNNGALELKNFRIFKRLGGGDIGTVHLAELIGTRTLFAVKVMDKDVLVHRKKILRAQAEREILQSLDHPFLPTLYSHFETEKLSCLVIEFCPGGDLHSLRQKQTGKFFPEHAARFYLAEVLLALEYLHMLGIIYRDLKPENVLVREDGHIMLSDFDLSLRCASSPTLVKSSNPNLESKNSSHCVQPACMEPSCVVQTSCIQPTCFSPHFLVGKPKRDKSHRSRMKSDIHNQMSMLPELRAEPTNARSMSFVGTHEYLAPEIIKGEGHGSAVDWWTFGIFLYELLFGITPFRGAANRATLFNVVGQPLRFPDSPTVSFAARDLIRGLLVKEPQHRLAYRRGASEIKQHPFFQNVNWALIRCATPPDVPPPFSMNGAEASQPLEVQKVEIVDVKPAGNYYEIDFF